MLQNRNCIVMRGLFLWIVGCAVPAMAQVDKTHGIIKTLYHECVPAQVSLLVEIQTPAAALLSLMDSFGLQPVRGYREQEYCRRGGRHRIRDRIRGQHQKPEP